MLETKQEKWLQGCCLLPTLGAGAGPVTSDHPFPWKIFWRSKAPSRVAFFV